MKYNLTYSLYDKKYYMYNITLTEVSNIKTSTKYKNLNAFLKIDILLAPSYSYILEMFIVYKYCYIEYFLLYIYFEKNIIKNSVLR